MSLLWRMWWNRVSSFRWKSIASCLAYQKTGWKWFWSSICTPERFEKRALRGDSLNRYREPLNGAKDMNFCQKLLQGPYYMSVNSKGSGQTALMCRLTWAFAGHLCDNDLSSWAGSFVLVEFFISLLRIKQNCLKCGQKFLNNRRPNNKQWKWEGQACRCILMLSTLGRIFSRRHF